MIRDIPFTVIAVLVASLVECFLILPNHMTHAIAHSAKEHWYDLPSRIVNRGFRWLRDRAFRPLIALVVRARYVVLAALVAVLASQVALLIRGDVQWRFFNAPEQGSVTGNFAMARRRNPRRLAGDDARDAARDRGAGGRVRRALRRATRSTSCWPRSAATPGAGWAGSRPRIPTCWAASRSS